LLLPARGKLPPDGLASVLPDVPVDELLDEVDVRLELDCEPPAEVVERLALPCVPLQPASSAAAATKGMTNS
jgi:hypothetical protein